MTDGPFYQTALHRFPGGNLCQNPALLTLTSPRVQSWRPMLFSLYTPLSLLLLRNPALPHLPFGHSNRAMHLCVSQRHLYLDVHQLKLNLDKTEILICPEKHCSENIKTADLPSQSAKNREVIPDKLLSCSALLAVTTHTCKDVSYITPGPGNCHLPPGLLLPASAIRPL